MARLRGLCCIAALSFLLVLPTQAGTLAYSMSGELIGLQDDTSSILSNFFSIGDLVTLLITVDTSAVDHTPTDPEVGIYPGATFQLFIGDFKWAGAADHRAIDRPDGDYYSIINEVGFVGATFGSLAPQAFFLQFLDSLGTLLSSDALIATVPNLSDFDTQINGIRLGDSTESGDFGVLRFNINSVSAVIPVPAGLWLLLSSLAGLGVLRKRHIV